jgi:hypothetical protein
MDYSHIVPPRPLSAKLLGKEFGLDPCVAIEHLTFDAVVCLGAWETSALVGSFSISGSVRSCVSILIGQSIIRPAGYARQPRVSAAPPQIVTMSNSGITCSCQMITLRRCAKPIRRKSDKVPSENLACDQDSQHSQRRDRQRRIKTRVPRGHRFDRLAATSIEQPLSCRQASYSGAPASISSGACSSGRPHASDREHG